MKTYLVETNNQLLELLSLKEVRARLQSGTLKWDQRIYDDSEGGWVAMSQHSALLFSKPKALAPVPRQELAPALAREWYYLQGQTPIGAFTYLEMIRLLQAGKIESDAVVWKPGVKNWSPASLLPDFHSSAIQQIHQSGIPGVKNYFQQRRFMRYSYEANFVLHNEEQIWKAISYELAPGGLGLLLSGFDLNIGQEVFVHKTSRGGTLSINAVAVVRSKSTKDLRPGQMKLGLEFVDISKETIEEINQSFGLIQLKSSR